MKTVKELLQPMEAVLADIPGAIRAQKAQGKKIVGVFPIYAPEELVHAAGMFPVGCWGGQVTISQATALLPPFACPVMQGITELSLTGGYDLLDGAILSSPCDTLKCLTQNFMRTCPGIKPIFCIYPQNNKLEGGVRYIYQQLKEVAAQLEELSGKPITDQALHDSIELYNDSRAAMMDLTALLMEKPGALTATERYYQWPGNIRELRNVMEQLVVLSTRDEIAPELVRAILYGNGADGSEPAVEVRRLIPLKQAVSMTEIQILEMVKQVETSSYKAARLLEVDQTTVLRKLKKYHIEGFHSEKERKGSGT